MRTRELPVEAGGPVADERSQPPVLGGSIRPVLRYLENLVVP